MANNLTPHGQVYRDPTPPATPEPSHDLGDFTPSVSPCQSLDNQTSIAITPGIGGPVRVQPTQQMQRLGPGSQAYASAADID